MQFHPGEPLRGTAAVLAPAMASSFPAAAAKALPKRDERGRFQPPENWLTLADVFTQLNLTRCRLAVLNGCESAMLHPSVTDDAESLTTGFLFAGAPAVVSTLWAVWDISAALLMDKFHALWKAGHAPADALHEAARWLRQDIKTGRQLVEEILPPFLARVDDKKVRERCEEIAQKHAGRFPDSPPFAAPGHWAAFIASGAVF